MDLGSSLAKLQTYLTCAQASNHASVIYIFKTNQLDPRSLAGRVISIVHLNRLIPSKDQGSRARSCIAIELDIIYNIG